MNSVILIGRLAKDVELQFIPQTGMAVSKFSLAVDKDMSKDKKQEMQRQNKATADFINITVFGKQAESCANFLSKGNKCAIHGRITTGSYTTQTGEKRYTTDIIADRVEFIESKPQQQQQPKDDFDDNSWTPTDEDFPF